ncbi:MAG: transketolase family protein [Solobacterium sp.]|nr:transketolase family protein [Solobacterium sp.]MBQ6591389.1 transketolase family protein [Solobacterium sp.]MBR0478750.1 transketolase family protein [Solobacterium sp.]
MKKIATRESYGKALAELGAEFPQLVVLDADLANATKTELFKKVYPERHIDCGIAESNMMGIAAGLAAAGMIPFASTFAMFAAGRAYEQVRNSIAYPRLNVKIGATHAGISVGEDGASHQCLEDFALMRVIPGMVVICPADDIEARQAVRAAIEYNGPVYLRFGRSAVPVINDDNYTFQIGKGHVLRSGKDVTIVANGITVAGALEAAERLAAEGTDAEVINISTIKPLDTELLLASAAKTGKVVTCEEHSIIGGLGSAVAECLSESLPVRMLRIGVRDRFGESGPAAELIHKYQLDGEGIYTQIKDFLK